MTTGIASPLQVDGTSYASPALGVLLVVLAVGTPAVTGVVVGRVKNRRAAALQEAVWPGATRVAEDSPAPLVNAVTGAIPRVTRGGRDTVAIVGGAVVGVLLVATAAIAAAPVLAPVAEGSQQAVTVE
ncbi:hypothetical protein [Isoptericola croceus]|uniref:hypothetical protein n=1 Tax=Isoptericola croceus TaxID=3031406 RepID=UPI0023F93881|nr:hypothetical protein [Isoptericola croceus]